MHSLSLKLVAILFIIQMNKQLSIAKNRQDSLSYHLSSIQVSCIGLYYKNFEILDSSTKHVCSLLTLYIKGLTDKYETDELHIPNMFQVSIIVCYLTVITILSLIVIHWRGCIPFSIILLSTFTKQINDPVVRNLRRVSHVNLLVNFKNKQYCGCCQLIYFPLLHMSKCQDSRFNYCILALWANHITCRSSKRQKISRKLST
jgi:hypothetical protein